MENNNKTALITGASKRIGKAIAVYLAKEGYDIALHYNNSKEDALETKELINNYGRSCTLIQADLSDSSSYSKIIDDAIEATGNIDVLINNASVFEKCSFLNTSEEIFDSNISLHLKAPFFLTQNFARKCKEGCVINIIDSKISSNEAAYFSYLLSKKSLFDFTMMAAKDLAPYIRVNAICPGSILPSEYWSKEDIDNKNSKLPMQSTPTLDDICSNIHHLINAKSLTGQCLYVDSGQSL